MGLFLVMPAALFHAACVRRHEVQRHTYKPSQLRSQREDVMGTIAFKTSLAALAVLASAGRAVADEGRFISVGGVKGAIDPIIADFTKATGHTVKYTVGSPLVVSQKLAAGEAFDVVVQSAPAMADFAKLNGLK